MLSNPVIICVLSGPHPWLRFCCNGFIRGTIAGFVIAIDAATLTGSITLSAIVAASFVVGCVAGVLTPATNWLKHEFDSRQALVPPAPHLNSTKTLTEGVFDTPSVRSKTWLLFDLFRFFLAFFSAYASSKSNRKNECKCGAFV